MKMYVESANWFHLLTSPADYEEEAGIYTQTLLDLAPGAVTLLELGSGGGNNASWMKRRFKMTLVDLSSEMLALSKTINPELEHIQGDMRFIRLDRQFDAVFIHDAICYMTTPQDLLQALITAYQHCKPGGAAVFCPDLVKENFQPDTDHGGHDSPDGRAMRYLEWFWDPDPSDNQYIADYSYLLREVDGSVKVEYDRHICGLFRQQEWLDLIQQAGFIPGVLPFRHSEVPVGSIFFTGKKPL